MKMSKEEYEKALKSEFDKCSDISKIEELIEEYVLILQMPHAEAEMKNILLEYAEDILDVLDLK